MVQRADTSTSREVWSEHYERSLANVFALQDEITASVVVAVEPQIYVAERDACIKNLLADWMPGTVSFAPSPRCGCVTRRIMKQPLRS